MGVYDTESNKLIEKVANELKNTIKAPEWSELVKTGSNRERPPESKDWWYFRAASILRKIYILGPIGVEKLRTVYGGRKNRGHKPSRFAKSSGKVIRSILQQLEESKLIEKVKNNKRKGRVVSAKGKSFLDKLSKNG